MPLVNTSDVSPIILQALCFTDAWGHFICNSHKLFISAHAFLSFISWHFDVVLCSIIVVGIYKSRKIG